MKQSFLLIFCCVFFLVGSVSPAEARLAECDACGYCQGQEIPDNWSSCAACLYPQIISPGEAATSDKTLQIVDGAEDPNNAGDILFNRPPQPAKGKYYTQLGCLDTGLLSFRDNPGAAGALVNFILNTLLFPIAGTLAFGVIIYGAFLLLTAQGDQMKIALGKRLVTSSIIGVVFTFGVVFIINIIAADILKIPGFARGSSYRIAVATRCSSPPVGHPAGDDPCSNIAISVDESASGKELTKIDIGELKGAIEVDPTTATVFTSSLGTKFDPSTMSFKLTVLDDYWVPPPNTKDKNAFIQTIVIDSQRCTNLKYVTVHSTSFDVPLNGTTLRPLSWKGTATCTNWVPLAP